MLSGAIPTKAMLVDRIGHRDLSCAICRIEIESYLHLFKECHGVRAIAFASKSEIKLDSWEVTNLQELMDVSPPDDCVGYMGVSMNLMTILLSSMWYCYWNFCNSLVHSSGDRLENVVFLFDCMVGQICEFDTGGRIFRKSSRQD